MFGLRIGLKIWEGCPNQVTFAQGNVPNFRSKGLRVSGRNKEYRCTLLVDIYNLRIMLGKCET